MKNSDFIYIPSWAINDLKLKGNELMTYSIIFSYSRDGIQWYKAPAEYLSTCVGTSVSTIKDILKRLCEKGLIKKREEREGSINRCYYQAVLLENSEISPEEVTVPKRYSENVSQYRNGTTIPLGSHSTETVLNNTINNNTTKIGPTSSSSRHSLLKNKNNSDKSNLAKIEKFVCDCHYISDEFGFINKVSDKLVDFFRMLAQSGTFLPDITIRAQLEDLICLTDDQKIEAISDTIKSGWKSLKYAVDKIKTSKTAAFDTSKPGSFQPKDPKNDRRKEQYEDDEVF